MKHTALYLAVAIVCWSTIDAQVIKLEPKYIKDAVINNPATEIEYDTLCTELTIPDVSEFVSLENYRFPNLKKITFNNLDYLPGGVFHGMPHLEEVVFDGLIGHFDCTMAGYCPDRKSVV